MRDPQGLNIVRRGGMGFLFKSQFLVFRAKQPVVQFVKIWEININISQNTIYWAWTLPEIKILIVRLECKTTFAKLAQILSRQVKTAIKLDPMTMIGNVLQNSIWYRRWWGKRTRVDQDILLNRRNSFCVRCLSVYGSPLPPLIQFNTSLVHFFFIGATISCCWLILCLFS